jgi:hypothetical protein
MLQLLKSMQLVGDSHLILVISKSESCSLNQDNMLPYKDLHFQLII